MPYIAKYNPCSKEFQDEAKRLGLTGIQYIRRLRNEGKLVDPTDVERKRLETLSVKMGYSSNAERAKKKTWDNGKSSPMSENYICSSYLGVYIAENIISKVFEDPIRMPYGNRGFDFICKKGLKIDCKSSILVDGIKWLFHIGYNEIADYFILVAFDNRNNLCPIHVWLIKKDEIVRKGTRNGGHKLEKLYNRENISIYNDVESSMSFLHFRKYEVIDKLEKLKQCCSERETLP